MTQFSMHKYFLPMAMLFLSACSDQAATNSQNNPSNSPSTANNEVNAKANDFVSKLPANAPTLQVVTSRSTAPYSFSDAYGNQQGFDIDLIHAVGKKAGFKVELISATPNEVLASVAKGKYPIGIGGHTYSKERENAYALSKPYTYSPSAMLFDPNININGLSDVKHLKVGVLNASTQIHDLKAIGKTDYIVVDTPYLLYDGLLKKKYDVALFSSATFHEIMKNQKKIKMNIRSYESTSNAEAYQVFLMQKGDIKLKNKIDKALTQLKADGTIRKLEKKWVPELS
ncbi:substrate-binding periplasmic protein [Acinetobacter sp. c3-l95]|uniref:substrate-binding periplasmic protein n=1 Tax=Acinetobacter sp. c3-l95 TaxID=3342804 RepID=UPI0035BA23E7